MLKKLGLESRPVQALAAGGLFALALLWAFALWRWRLSPDFVPLHYTVYFGFDRFGPRSDLFLFPTLGTAVAGINLAVAAAVFKNNKLWQSWWLAMNLLWLAILGFALILIVLRRLT